MPQAKIDAQGNTVFTLVVSDLPLDASDIFNASIKYMKNEYKTAKYSDIQEYGDKGIVIGKSKLNSFYTDNGLINSEVFSVDYQMRLDSKNNMVRIQLIFDKYNLLKLSDSSNNQTTEILISSVEPFSQSKNSKRYKNAYEKLQEYVDKVFSSVIQAIKATTPTPTEDEW